MTEERTRPHEVTKAPIPTEFRSDTEGWSNRQLNERIQELEAKLQWPPTEMKVGTGRIQVDPYDSLRQIRIWALDTSGEEWMELCRIVKRLEQ